MRKGKTNNPNGRPRGSKNKVNQNLREILNKFLSKHLEALDKEYEKLEPRDKIKFISLMFQYALPKYNPVEYKETENKRDIVWEELIKSGGKGITEYCYEEIYGPNNQNNLK